MLHFENDYNKGVHPRLLKALADTNELGMPGYGMDDYTRSAIEKIRQATDCPQAQVTFVTGGTQTNQLVINAMLASYEGVLAAETGHIAVHEAGAIEFSGHKVLPLPQEQGKIKAEDARAWIENFYADDNHTHMVFPGMIYISQPTEYGTLYQKDELEALSQVAKDYQIPLFVDGARLGYALGAPENDVDLPLLARLADVFYIGGTKLGALIGEAIVFTKQNEPRHFSTVVKQHGALLAKGRVNGVQFDVFFTDGLYEEIGREAVVRAQKMVEILKKKGFTLYLESPTNQQFVLVPNEMLETLKQKGIVYGFWEVVDDQHTVIRFATSWSTSDQDLQALEELL